MRLYAILQKTGVATLLVLLLNGMGSWGFLVHKTAHQLAVYELPVGLQDFFYHNLDYLEYNSVRPDVRRNQDSTEASKHFINLEAYGKKAASKMPHTWNAAVQRYTSDSLLQYGYVPYHILAMKDRLTLAFRSGNKDSILFYAADLGHYVEDANVPLHTSVNYDGQLTGQKGVHSLWESTIPEIEIGNYHLNTTHRAQYLRHPEKAVWQAVKRAHNLLPALLAKEKEVSARFTDEQKFRTQVRKGKAYKTYTTEFAKAYAASLKNTINEQLIHSANLVADFWYTAWVDAGRPNLARLNDGGLSSGEQAALAKELDAFHHNRLVVDNLLRARQQTKEAAAE